MEEEKKEPEPTEAIEEKIAGETFLEVSHELNISVLFLSVWLAAEFIV